LRSRQIFRDLHGPVYQMKIFQCELLYAELQEIVLQSGKARNVSARRQIMPDHEALVESGSTNDDSRKVAWPALRRTESSASTRSQGINLAAIPHVAQE
jgi:hypothetical protein